MSQSASEQEPKPVFFVIRDTGKALVAVALIAVDELPPGIGIANISKNLGLDETTGMTSLGLHRRCENHYQVSMKGYEATEKEKISNTLNKG